MKAEDENKLFDLIALNGTIEVLEFIAMRFYKTGSDGQKKLIALVREEHKSMLSAHYAGIDF